MYTLFCRTAAAMLALVAGTALASPVLRIGIEGEYPPFNQVDRNGKLVGLDVDLSEALCAQMQVKCSYVVQSWNGIIPALLSHKSDLIISSVAITDQRMRVLAFSKPYYIEKAIFVGPRQHPLQITPQGLAGKTIGVQGATTYEKMLRDKFPGVQVRLYGAVSDHNLDLQSGRVDAVLASDLVMAGWLASPEGKAYTVQGAPIRDPAYMGQGAGIAMRKDDPALLARVNAALDALRQNGRFEAISKKYFSFPIAP